MRKYLAGCLTAIVLSTPATALASFSNMYVFGDSLSDNGNLYNWTAAPNPVTGVLPIAISPPYFAGRFENGKSYSELLWSDLQSSGHLQTSGDLSPRGLKPWGPPELDPNPPAGTNYAVGGARSRYHRFDIAAGSLPPLGLPPGAALFSPFSLLGQYQQFSADYGGSADPNALYVVWAGSNDVGDALELINPALGSNALVPALMRLGEAITDVSTVLSGLVGEGAHYLLVPNVPDLGLVPETNSDPDVSGAATLLSTIYNAALNQVLDSLSGTSIYRYDSFGFLQHVVKSPPEFGFTNVTDACLQGLFVAPPPTGPVSICSTPDDYLFWDTLHPSAHAHELLAQGMLLAVPEPATMLLLGISLVALRLGTRRITPTKRFFNVAAQV